MVPGLGAGGFSASASSSSSSGPIGDAAMHVGGIQTGGTQGSLPPMAWIAIAVVVGLLLWQRRRGS